MINNNNVKRKVYVGNVNIEMIGKEVDFPVEVLELVVKDNPKEWVMIFDAWTEKYNTILGNLELPSLGMKAFSFSKLVEVTGDVILADNELTDLQFASLKKIGGYLDLRNNEFKPEVLEKISFEYGYSMISKELLYGEFYICGERHPQNFSTPEIREGEHHIYFFDSTRFLTKREDFLVGPNGVESNYTVFDLVRYELDFRWSLDEEKKRTAKGKSPVIPMTFYPDYNITVMPFRYTYPESMTVNSIEEVISLIEENKIKETVIFPLLQLRATFDICINDPTNAEFGHLPKIDMCCCAHYMLSLIKRALKNMGYNSENVDLDEKSPLPIFGELTKQDGTKINIEAIAGQ